MVGAIGVAICLGLLAGTTFLVAGYGIWAALAVYSTTGIVVVLAVILLRLIRPKLSISRPGAIPRSDEPQYKR